MKLIMTSRISGRADSAAKPVAMALAIASCFTSFSLYSSFAAAQAAPSGQDNSLAQIITTATRSPQNPKDVLSDNVLITSEDIARAGQTSLLDLLQRQRGIEIARNGGPGTSSSVYIRGTSNSQSIVLVDGVRIGSSTIGGATWEALPLDQIDHIEIVYGPLSSLYGADAIGGVVQIFTKKGSGAPRASVEAGYGSYGSHSLSTSISGATDSEHRFSYAISAAHEGSEGFSATKPGNFSYNPDRDGYTKESASGQFALSLARGQEVGLTFLHSRLDAQYDSGASTYDTRTLQKLDNTAVFSRNQITADWSSLLQFSRSADKSGDDSSATASGKNQANTIQTDLSWQNDIVIGADLLQLVLERRKEKVDTTSTPTLNGDRSTNSVAALYQLKRGAHLASFAVRNDDSSQYGSHTTGSLGYGYKINDSLRANASYGTSFRAPTFNELYYPQYGVASNKPEKGKNAEIGLVYDNGVSKASAVFYRNRVTDLIVNASVCPVDPDNHAFGCAYNVDHAVLTGITLGGSTQLAAFTVRGSVDLQDPRDETTDKLLTRRSRHHATLGADYGQGALKGGAEFILSGKRFDNVDNTSVLGGYGLLNLYATYDVARDWTLLARWNNVADKNYELAKNYGTAGSTVFVGLRYAMK